MSRRALARAYGRSAQAWAEGPGRIYDVLADELVACSPRPLAGGRYLDVGAGRGAATRALERTGARAVPLDVAAEMLAASAAAGGPGGAVADALALPMPAACVDGVVAAFSYNHVTDPAAALVEAARVTVRGGVVLASAYAHDDDHPVKAAVDHAAMAAGWQPEPWMRDLRADAAPLLATVERAADVAGAAGLPDATVTRVERPFPDLGPESLVAWRLGMAAVAPFLADLTDAARRQVAADALERLGDPPVLVRRMVVIAAIV